MWQRNELAIEGDVNRAETASAARGKHVSKSDHTAPLPLLYVEHQHLMRRLEVYQPRTLEDLLSLPINGVLTAYLGYHGGIAALRDAGAETLSHLVQMRREDLLRVAGLGERRVATIESVLALLGLSLAPTSARNRTLFN